MAQSAVETMGIITFLMMRSNHYSKMSIEDVRGLCQPPMDAGLALTAKSREATETGIAAGQPMAFALFAKVDDFWHDKLNNPRFPAHEMPAEAWTSGDHYWLVALLGLAEVAPQFALQAANTLFSSGDTLHLRMMEADGSVKISQRTL